MSVQKGTTISPRVEALLYFIGLILVYVASWAPPVAAPSVVRTVFGLLGTVAIVVKYELSTQPKPQITSHQALFSTIALILSVAGGQISSIYPSVWYGGLIVAIIGAILAAYQDLGGSVPTTSSAGTPITPTPPSTTAIAAPFGMSTADVVMSTAAMATSYTQYTLTISP
jgi:hypothetical protein